MAKIVKLYPEKNSPDCSGQKSAAAMMRDEIVVEILGVLKYLLDPPADRRPYRWLTAQEMVKKMKITTAQLLELQESGCISYLYLDGEYYYYSKDVYKRIAKTEKKDKIK